MSTPVIELSDISFRRGDKYILRDINWQIKPGQHWALLGANGSGKTSLLKIITGYEWPTQGSVTVLGRRFGNCILRDLRKTIGMVSAHISPRIPKDDRAVDIVGSGYEASLGLYRELVEEELRPAYAALEKLNASHIAEQPYKQLSQGEQQKVLIARALINNPRLLILDEPCAGLDPRARERFLDDVGRMIESPQAPTIIFVTHHIEEICPWITHVLFLKNGRELTQGTPIQTITDFILSEAFGCSCRIIENGRRYGLMLE